VEPHIVGAYEMGPLLGTGTVGEVYRARHRETGQPAVVKLLLPEAAGEPEVQRRFVREVAISERLDHPNIVRHYDCGLYNDRIYFAMELVECGTLKQVLRRRGALAWREAVATAIQVCGALEYAHWQGVIHRDLKPANIFFAANGHVKIGDFGLARDLNKSRLTLEGQTVGTCRYMPPEQISGDAKLTGATDLYALGCILFEMLVGRPPFNGNTVIEIFEAHLYNEPERPIALVRDCPQDLSELVLMLLAKEPERRPASAAETQSALEDILNGRAMRLKPRETGQSSSDATSPPGPELPIRVVEAGRDRSPAPPVLSSIRWWLAVGVLAAAAAIGIFAATR
jgi:serine/threonine protein kinase